MAVYNSKLISHDDRSVVLDCGNNGVKCTISIATEETFRVLFTLRDSFRQPRTWSVVPRGQNDVPWEGILRENVLESFPSVPNQITIAESGVIISTKKLTLQIIFSPLSLIWKDHNGVTVARDRPSRPYRITETGGVSHHMVRTAGDHFHGLGDKTGGLNLHGRRLRTAMRDALGYNPQTGDPLYKHWPLLIGRDSQSGSYYGILYDSLAEATFDLGCEHSNYYGLYRTYETKDGDLDYYFMVGPSLREVVAANARLTGGMVLGPRWTLGYHCTAMPLADAPNAQERISEFVDFCQKYVVPCSAFHFGSGYTSIGPRRYVYNWNTSKFPDPKRLIARFREAGMRVVANLKPCLLSDHPRFEEAVRSGAFICEASSGTPTITQFWDGEGAHLDFTQWSAIRWWQKGLQEAILDVGIDSAWNDNNEYEIADEEDSVCAGFGNPIPIQLARPLHSLLMTRASFEQQSLHRPNDRPYTVTRAGCFGIQRYAQTWSGDNTTSWETLRYNLRTGLQMSMSGLFNIGHDVGGFAGDAPDPELLVRWVQTGVLHPRFIMNSWKPDGRVTTPWLHPQVLPFTRWAIRLRYRLVPYLYSLYRTATHCHEPILRPTFFDFPDDKICFEENDEVMVGPYLLAAPVVIPGARERSVYFPTGPSGWYDFYSGEWYPSGQLATVAAPLDRLPLFVPAGGMVVVTSEAKDFGRLHDEPSRLVKVFPPLGDGGVSEFQLWEDDGISLDDGSDIAKFRVLKIVVQAGKSEVVVRVQSERGTYNLPYKTLQVSLPLADDRKLTLEVVQGEEDPFDLQLFSGCFDLHAF